MSHRETKKNAYWLTVYKHGKMLLKAAEHIRRRFCRSVI